MHDADLFIFQPSMLDELYIECRDRNLACLGINQVWDDWFEQQGRRLAATWEMTYDLSWARLFAPYTYMPRESRTSAGNHSFDVSLYPQYLTDAYRIGLVDKTFDHVHLNHVIGTYRRFQNAITPIEDRNFRLLLVRLLSDAMGFADSTSLPSLKALKSALKGHGANVTYPAPEEDVCRRYAEFRSAVGQMLLHRVFDADSGDWIRRSLLVFDEYYGGV